MRLRNKLAKNVKSKAITKKIKWKEYESWANTDMLDSEMKFWNISFIYKFSFKMYLTNWITISANTSDWHIKSDRSGRINYCLIN